MRRWGALAALLAAGAVFAHAAAGGCGSNGSPGAGADGDGGGQAGGDGGSSTTTTTTTSSSGAGGGSCPPLAPPPVVPEGWVEYGEWSCDCRFYLPGSVALMPPPINWQPCPDAPAGIDCRSIPVTWTEASTAVGLTPSFWHEPGGKDVLMYSQLADTHALDLIAEIDGPVQFAVMVPFPPGVGPASTDPGCFTIPAEVDDGRFAIRALGHDADGKQSQSPHKGALAGTLGSLTPFVLQRFEDEQMHSWNISGELVARGSAPSFEVVVMPWDMSSETLVTSPALDIEGHRTSQVLVSGPAVFFGTYGSSRGINVWTEAEGAQPFVRYIGDATRAAGDLGTDGLDLVWTYGEDKEPGDTFYPTRSVMTALFTTDPDALEPRRLRAQIDKSIGLFPHIVGCGHAAHRGDSNDTVVVRLSDGVAWVVPLAFPSFVPSHPIGLTCQEVIILGEFGSQTTIARVRLDSLGPGIAPD